MAETLDRVLTEVIYQAVVDDAPSGPDWAIETARAALVTMAAPEHRDALVAWLVEAGIGPALLTGDERRVVSDALRDLIEDYPEQAASKRDEAATSTDKGLLAEADSFDRDCATAQALLGRIGGDRG